jgi:hypothetical protein
MAGEAFDYEVHWRDLPVDMNTVQDSGSIIRNVEIERVRWWVVDSDDEDEFREKARERIEPGTIYGCILELLKRAE